MYWGMYAKRLRRAWENVFKTYSMKFPKLRKILIKDLKISIFPVFLKKASFQYLPDSFIYLLF